MGAQSISKKINPEILDEFVELEIDKEILKKNYEKFYIRSKSLSNINFFEERNKLKNRAILELLMKISSEKDENKYLFNLLTPFANNIKGISYAPLQISYLDKSKNINNIFDILLNENAFKNIPIEKDVEEDKFSNRKINLLDRLKIRFSKFLKNLSISVCMIKIIREKRKVFLKEKKMAEKDLQLEKEKIAKIWKILETRAELLKEQYRVKKSTEKLIDKIQKFIIEKLYLFEKKRKDYIDEINQRRLEEELDYKFMSEELKKVNEIKSNEYKALKRLTEERKKFEKEKKEFLKRMEAEKWEISEQWKILLEERQKLLRDYNEKMMEELAKIRERKEFNSNRILGIENNKIEGNRITCKTCGLKLPLGKTFCPRCGLERVTNMLKITHNLTKKE